MRRASLTVLAPLGSAMLASVLACGSSDVAAHAASAKTVVDLGLQPPLLRATIRRGLAPLEEGRCFERVLTTCGCLGATLLADGRPVAAGSRVEEGQELAVIAELEGRGHAGRSVETVRVFFSAGDHGSGAVKRELEIRCVFDVTKSVVGGRRPLVFVPLPGGEGCEILPLDLPLVGSELRAEGPAWLRADFVKDETGAGPGTLRMQLGPVDIAALYEANVILPIADGFYERMPVSLRVASKELLRPERITARLPVGATQELPVILVGENLKVTPSGIEWEWGEAGASNPSSRPQVGLRAAPGAEDSVDGLRLTLRVRAGKTPGAYKGRALIRPRPGCSYRLALPWLVRVTAGVASVLPAANEERDR